MLYNTTTTTTTTSVHLAKTSVRMKTSWPLASTSTTSTSRMEHATCSTSHNHDFLHLPSLTVRRQHFQSGLVNSWPTSTSANSSTSTSLTSPTTRRSLLQQTSWLYKLKQEHVKELRLYVSELHRQALQVERELPQEKRREHGVTDPEIQQATNDLNAQQLTSGCNNYSSTSSRRTLRLARHACHQTG